MSPSPPLLWRLDRYGISSARTAAPLMKYAERIFSRAAFIEAASPLPRKWMRKYIGPDGRPVANAEYPPSVLLRALYEWCVDMATTAHLAVKVDSRSQVPSEYVRNGKSPSCRPAPCTSCRWLELIEFSARFSGVGSPISVPVARVYALYARETGQGMTFEVDAAKPAIQASGKEPLGHAGPPTNPARPRSPVPAGLQTAAPTESNQAYGGKPQLRRIK